MVDWITENAMPKGARYAVPYSKEPPLGCDPTHRGMVFLSLGPEGGEGVAAWCIGDIGDEGD
jgi:hypothetical protein